MHNRVVDRSAAHATPALLAVRDWLLVALSFSTGIYEAISFLTFGKVFTAFQTGNIVGLGLGVAGTRPPAGPDPVTVVVSLAAFAVGAGVGIRILPTFDGNEAVGDDEVFQVWAPPTWSLTEHAVRRLGGTIVSMAAGAFLGDWMLSHAHRYAPLLPAVVTAVVIVIAWVVLRPSSGESLGRASRRQ